MKMTSTSTEQERLIQELCEKYHLPTQTFKRLVEEERKIRHLKIRQGVLEQLHKIIKESLPER